MASTYSTSLKLTLIGDGDQAGIWGQTTNTNLGTLLEQSITGVESIVMTDANYTLTSYNGVLDQARNAVLVVTGTNTAVRDVIPPVAEKMYTVVNNTSGGYAVRVIGATGTGVSVPNGYTALVYCNGTNFYQALSSGATSVNTSNYTIEQQGSTLVTQYNGANVVTIGSTGTLTAVTSNATTFNGTTANVTTFNGTTANVTTANVTTANVTTVNATTANATTVTIGGFNITANATTLQFKYGANVVMSMDTTGNLTSATNITAYGTP
jgi:hypothetical protein